MEFIGIAHDRPGFLDDLVDRRLVQRAHSARQIRGQGATHFHGPCPAFFKRGIVEIGVRIGIQNFMAERGRHRRIDGHTGDRARFDFLQHRDQAFDDPWLR